VASGIFHVEKSWTVEEIIQSGKNWDELPCWMPFDRLLDDYDRAQATPEERIALLQGKQSVLVDIVQRREHSPLNSRQSHDCFAVYCGSALIAVARKDNELWGIERVFT
jgi:hypothetical protein